MFFLGYMNILENVSRMLMVNFYTYMSFRADRYLEHQNASLQPH